MSGRTTHEEGVRTPVVLVIRDGWGENPNPEHDAFNAVKLANTPVDDALRANWPHTLITTCGEDVGLPHGVMGNSEVGHQNIGAGRIVDQEVMRITRAIRDGSFFQNAALNDAITHATARGTRLHLLGLVSDGKVHSDLEHLIALIELAAKRGVPAYRLCVHVITDGRDTSPHGGASYLHAVLDALERLGVGRVATVIGRYYAMDRDNRWERVHAAYAALRGWTADPRTETGRDAQSVIQTYYDHPSEPSRTGDEFITPTIIVDAEHNPVGPVDDGDAVIFFNFRGDRPREISRAFVLDDAAWADVPNGGFDRGARVADLFFCGMTAYEQGLPLSAVAFPKPPRLRNILGEVIAAAGLKQFRCAETEKFPHVTFFFNDYREEPFVGERRLLCPSPRDVSTYDQRPEMSAHAVCDGVVARLHAEDCEDLLVVNFANPDMVGHTGSLDATIRAVEVVDACVGRIVEATLERSGSVIVAADHGNAEQMWSLEHNGPHTAHTTFDVPLIVAGEPWRGTSLRAGGRLADIAPTLLTMMHLHQPEEMTGRSLL